MPTGPHTRSAMSLLRYMRSLRFRKALAMATTPAHTPARASKQRKRPLAVDPSEELRYPTSQGLARQGTWLYADALTQAYQALRRHFRGRDDLFIAQNLCLFDVRDGKERCLIPDLFVALDVGHAPRRIYKVWEEGKVPDFVLEVSSKSTIHRAKGFKLGRYRSLGVREYWHLDTVGDLLQTRLRGYRLVGGRFDERAASGRRDGRREFRSDVLGLRLRAARDTGGAKLAFRDPLTGKDIPTGPAMDRKQRESERSRSAERRGRIRAEKERDLEKCSRQQAETEFSSERRGKRRAEKRARALEAILRKRGGSQLELDFELSRIEESAAIGNGSEDD